MVCHIILFVIWSKILIPKEMHVSKLEYDKKLYYQDQPKNFSEKEIDCLAENIFHEAGTESVHGKLAVAQVTYNRLSLGKWGKNVYDVVYANNQFSWTKKKKQECSGPLWEESKEVAVLFNQGLKSKIIKDATHYHADYIEPPKWSKKYDKVAKIGKHKFYREVDS